LDAGARADAARPQVSPPLGGQSGGTGGTVPVDGTTLITSNTTYRLRVPSSYSPDVAIPLLLAYSGTEGGGQMMQNLRGAASSTGISGFIFVVMDGTTYNGNGQAGATVLDHVRTKYNIDNDRTYLLGESAGTTAAHALGFHLRPTWFAAYWANDINAADGPATHANQLGFAPWGQVGPGGQYAIAQQVVTAMRDKGYRLPDPAPYDGPGAEQHGNSSQFLAALSFFVGKARM
jgi:hypothetical protein